MWHHMTIKLQQQLLTDSTEVNFVKKKLVNVCTCMYWLIDSEGNIGWGGVCKFVCVLRGLIN